MRFLQTTLDVDIPSMQSQFVVLESIINFKNQAQAAWSSVKKIPLHFDKQTISNVVVAGMGGSTLGAHLAQSIFDRKLTVPLIISNNYKLPDFVGEHTLAIISSYSGNTEETLSALKDAEEKKALIFIIASGGKLLDLAKEKKLLYYEIDNHYNASGQPRYGLGYNFFGILGFLAKTGLLNVTEKEIETAIDQLPQTIEEEYAVWYKKDIQKTAKTLKNKIPVIVAAEFLIANAHILQNQFNESSKTFAVYFPIPEMNHHLLEALIRPKNLRKKIQFLFLNSSLYSESILKRFKNTKSILQNLDIGYTDIEITGKTPLLASLRMVSMGGLLSLELATLNNVNPSPVLIVEKFKKMMDL